MSPCCCWPRTSSPSGSFNCWMPVPRSQWRLGPGGRAVLLGDVMAYSSLLGLWLVGGWGLGGQQLLDLQIVQLVELIHHGFELGEIHLGREPQDVQRERGHGRG